MNNFDYLNKLSVDELAAWIAEYGIFDQSPWMKWFDSKYCKQCATIKASYTDSLGSNRPVELAYCEANTNCRFFTDLPEPPSLKDIVKAWLLENFAEN